MADETNNAVENVQNENSEGSMQGDSAIKQKQESAKKSFDELYAEGGDIKRWADSFAGKAVDAAIKNAVPKAVQEAITKQQRINDARLTESERLKEMTAEQQAAHWKKKAEDALKATERFKEVESLKTQTISMLSEHKIPDAFLDVFDFELATAEDIKQCVAMLADYDYRPKGTYEKALADGITAGVNDKLKQKPLETRVINNADANDPFLQGFNSGYGNYGKQPKKE